MTKLEEQIEMGEDPRSPIMGLGDAGGHHGGGAHHVGGGDHHGHLGGAGAPHQYYDDYTFLDQQQTQHLHLSSYQAPLVHTG